MSLFSKNLEAIQLQIVQSAARVQRNPATIQIVAVSKAQPLAAMAAAIQSGQHAFAENYVQEAVAKIRDCSRFTALHPLQWHFIGQLQRNKIRQVATHFDWVHTLVTLAQAQQLSRSRSLVQRPPLQVLIQLNLRSPTVGYGVLPEGLIPLVQAVQQLPHLCLRGLMVLSAATGDPQQTSALFYQTQALFQALQADYPRFDTLSMGMSHDLSEAIAAGSTLVRLGTALFGPRAVSRRG